MALSKEIRQMVHKMCYCHCGYCGKEITYKEMQVDHIEAHWHTMTQAQCDRVGIKKGSHELDNLMPACVRCNRWKSTFTIEQFRIEITAQIERLHKYNNNYRMAFDFNLVKETQSKVVFYFEHYINKNKQAS